MRKENEQFIAMINRIQFEPDDSHLPLANKPERFLELMMYLSQEENSTQSISVLSEVFTITSRQINFYGETGAKTFGLFNRTKKGYLSLTVIGKTLSEKTKKEQLSYLQQKLLRLKLFKDIRNQIKTPTTNDVEELIKSYPLFRENFSDSSIKRRAGTLISWLNWFKDQGVPVDENELDSYIKANVGLIYEVVHRLDSNRKHTEEYYSVATLGYQKALLSYKPDKNTKFSTYAFVCMQNEVLAHIRSEKRWNVFNHLSIDFKAEWQGGETGLRQENYFSMEEKLVSSEDTPEEALIQQENIAWLHNAIKQCTPKRQKVLSYYLEDKFTQVEIAAKVNTTQAGVSRMIRECIKELKELTLTPKPVISWRTARTST